MAGDRGCGLAKILKPNCSSVPNKEVDPELGVLNLSKGGSYPVQYALRLGAGFGSQISMSLLKWEPTPDGRRPSPSALGYQYRIEDRGRWESWLKRLTGYDSPELEVVQRTLRAKDQGMASGAENGNNHAQLTEKPSLPASTVKAPQEAPVAAAPPRKTVDEVQAKVMQIISEKTGYPTDMLDMDLDLEADLGIDTVKQAEMFAAIRAAYDIPREDNLKLRDFPTLAHAVKFVYDRRPDLYTAPARPWEARFRSAPSASGQGGKDAVQEQVLKIIAEKTGHPTDMLDMDLDLEADLGIVLSSRRRCRRDQAATTSARGQSEAARFPHTRACGEVRL